MCTYKSYIVRPEGRGVRFEWHERKDGVNQRKHGIGFETATRVFEDPRFYTVQDREVEGEARWQTIGVVNGIHLLVVHTVENKDGEEVIRIISARKATPHEKRAYEQAY